ncbi:MAG: AEC family transporter [Trueperaceae bacterium]|nr:AEC family transporter [Trueperaceae bacterium]
MSLSSSLFTIVLPAFLVMGVGGLLGYFFKPDVVSINRIGLYAAVPALLFDSLSTTELHLLSVARLAIAYILYLLSMFFLSWLISPRVKPERRRGFITTSIYANSANLLLPVVSFAFGEAGLERALILYAITSVSMFTTAPIVLTGGFANGLSVKKLLGLPVIWAAAFGLGFNLLGLHLPLGLQRGIEITGQAAIPLVLMVLGMNIQRSGISLPEALNYWGTFVSLCVGPIVAFALGYVFGLRELDLAVLTLIGAMPPAINTFMLALEFKADANSVAKTVILSTLVSLLTISVVVVFVQRLV